MTQSSFATALSAQTSIDAGRLRVCLDDARPELVAALIELAPHELQQFALEAWMIGGRALLNVRAQAQQAHLADIGRSLAADLRAHLAQQLEAQEQAITVGLRRYFDPEDGQLSERLRAFLDKNGVLEHALRQYVGAENSVIAQTLARVVGETSPLFKMLNPSDSEGLVQVLQCKVAEALEEHRGELEHALDPLQKDGAVGRFLVRLREELEESDKDRGDQLARVVAALDANEEGSLLSRMVREGREAHAALARAINLQLPDSPLATVKRTLEELLRERLEAQKQRFDQLLLSQQEFQREVREAVARIETRREEGAKSIRGGADFEADVLCFVQQAVPAGVCMFEPTGSLVGRRPNCKVGDAVVRFTEESAFCGSGVVFEAKRDGSHTVPSALAELEVAMANRGTDVGLFVMARSHAQDGFPGFARYGSKLLVTWDPEDHVSDGLLHGAIVAALALAQRKKASVSEGDINALADVEQRLLKELDRIGTMDKYAGNIQRDAGKISDELRKGRKVLERVIADAKETLCALNVELRDEAAEQATPIEVSATVPELSKASRDSTPGNRPGAIGDLFGHRGGPDLSDVSAAEE